MGALHGGHASLITRAVSECDLVVVSDFVNPTQFNNPEDLRTYPRSLEADVRLVASLGAQVLFVPSVQEMYPEPDKRVFDLAPLDTVMEGARRPGHFNGVAQIVSRLFELVEPDRAYFGEKDYQQLLIVRHMAHALGFKVEVVGCPIVREQDGLAKSSRNQLLTPEHRAVASTIYRTLQAAKQRLEQEGIAAATQFVELTINGTGLLHVEYFTIADATTLEPITRYVAGQARGFIAVQAGQVRLIDNIAY